jgi:hypothetical protein
MEKTISFGVTTIRQTEMSMYLEGIITGLMESLMILTERTIKYKGFLIKFKVKKIKLMD